MKTKTSHHQGSGLHDKRRQSRAKHRPNPQVFRSFLLKQLGSNSFGNDRPFKCADRHGGEWYEWPDDLRVREFPSGFYQWRGKEVTP
jgi:hypothetical protein